MQYALVAVDTYQDPTKKLFTYSIPDNLQNLALAGAKVKVPFGRRQVAGYIWDLTAKTPPFPVKPIQKVIGQTFSSNQVQLAHWMSRYYLGSPLECLKCQISEKGEREATAPVKDIETLLLVPYASQVKIRAAIEKQKNGKFLIGSRAAVFAQLPNLKKIVIEEPENWNYKDERAPYYHATLVAKKRAEIENLKLELRPSLPIVESYAEDQKHLPKINPIRVLDLNLEKSAGNFGFLSQELKNMLKRPNPTLIFSTSKVLQNSIREELQEQGLSKGSYQLAGPEIFAIPGLEVHRIFWIDADTLFNLPDFRAQEKLIHTAVNLAKLTKRGLTLQTKFPRHPLFQDLAQGKLKSFYQKELENREKTGYPPFCTLVKLSFSSKSAAKTTQEADKLVAKLAELSKSDKELEISPLYEPYQPKPGLFQLNLALKIKSREKKRVLEILQKIAPHLPPAWKVDVAPESLL